MNTQHNEITIGDEVLQTIMSSIGQIEPYCSSDDLDEYLERLDQFFVANDIGSLAAGVDDVRQSVNEWLHF